MRSCRRWSDLPLDLRGNIMERLSTADRARFRSVCTSWRSTPETLHPPHDIPWLMLSPPADAWVGDKNDERNCRFRQQHLRFYSMSENRMYKMNAGHLASIAAYCQGIVSYTPDGWLMCIDEIFELQCVHLPTGERIYPPSLTTLPQIRDSIDRRLAYYSCYKDGHTARDYHQKMDPSMWYYNRGVVLFQSSTPGSLLNTPTPEYGRQNLPSTGRDYVIVVWYKDQFLAYARKGDTSWIDIDDAIKVSHIRNIVVHQGSLYLSHRRGEATYRIGVNPDLSLCSAEVLPLFFNFSSINHSADTTYLVEVDGHLFQIWRMTELMPATRPYSEESEELIHFFAGTKTVNFNVFKMNETQTAWVETNTIGDYAIFVGNNYSFALSTRDFTHLTKNSIYFTDDEDTYFDCQVEWDLGVFNIEEHTVSSFYSELSCVALPQPTWVMPFQFFDSHT